MSYLLETERLRPFTEADGGLLYELNSDPEVMRFISSGKPTHATEGARALIDHGFSVLGMRAVAAFTMTVNAGSRRVMEKCDLRYARSYVRDRPEVIEGGEHGDVKYALSRAQWEQGASA
jgi:RimJ/RimL family protein N-acetyltransferase